VLQLTVDPIAVSRLPVSSLPIAELSVATGGSTAKLCASEPWYPTGIRNSPMPATDNFDAHCHLHLVEGGALVSDQSPQALVNGTREGDWDAVLDIAGRNPGRVVPSLGLHPWYVAEAKAGWEKRLCEQAGRSGAWIGECGLDRSRRKEVPMEDQIPALVSQLRIASELGVPVSLHCVQAWGGLLDLLEGDAWLAGRPFVLHSVACSAPLVAKFADLGAYFSVSFRTPDALLEHLPEDRILVETDHPFGGAESWEDALEAQVFRLGEQRKITRNQLKSNRLALLDQAAP